MEAKSSVIHKLSSAFLANLVSLIVSLAVVLVIPKFIDIEQYGHFQLYIFYIGFIGFINFGWPEGILLKMGGKKYDGLDKVGLKTQFSLFAAYCLVMAIIVMCLSSLFAAQNELPIWWGISIAILITLPTHFLQVILQMTNRIQEYATGVLVEKIVYSIGIALALGMGVENFYWFILADIGGRCLHLTYVSIANKSILCTRRKVISDEVPHIRENISVGSKLMLANLSSLFLIGIIRQSIEIHWSVEVFAKVSLTLSISNLLMVFIRAVAVVLFPLLKTVEPSKSQSIYMTLRTALSIILLGIMVFYFPMVRLLLKWLPNYAESFRYVALLFPMCVFECRMAMLIEVYMKAMRQEKELLRVNLICTLLSFILAIITVFVMDSIEAALGAIIIVLGTRCILAESILSAKLKITFLNDMIMEVLTIIGFIVMNSSIGGVAGFVGYLLLYFAYLLVKKNNVRQVFLLLKAHIARR